MTFSPDGRRIATGAMATRPLNYGMSRLGGNSPRSKNSKLRFNGVRFSPDGNSLLAVNEAGTLHLWRAPSFAEIDAAESGQPR